MARIVLLVIARVDFSPDFPYYWKQPAIDRPQAGDLLQQRIDRVLAVARAYGYNTLVLGAWGCGAFGNDPHRTAADFRQALGNDYGGAFSDSSVEVTASLMTETSAPRSSEATVTCSGSCHDCCA